MFTGIIEEIGTVEGIQIGEKSLKITIKANKVLEETLEGDSISTNGVCLTVTKINKNSFIADVMAESIKKSNLGNLKVGENINLERALSFNSRLGGHLVSGHIDGVGEIINIEKEDNATLLSVKAPLKILKYIVEKGSVALNGVSLTVICINSDFFKVGIIPHTKMKTILLDKKKGDILNIECDVIGKYVEKLLGTENKAPKESAISKNFLIENGFI